MVCVCVSRPLTDATVTEPRRRNSLNVSSASSRINTQVKKAIGSRLFLILCDWLNSTSVMTVTQVAFYLLTASILAKSNMYLLLHVHSLQFKNAYFFYLFVISN